LNRQFLNRHFWSILALASIPIVLSVQLFTTIDPINIITYQVPLLIGLLIAQKIFYRYRMDLCKRCNIQREFHNKSKYPQLHLVCDNFVKFHEEKFR